MKENEFLVEEAGEREAGKKGKKTTRGTVDKLRLRKMCERRAEGGM